MACSTPPQLESTLRIFTQDWYPSSPPPSRPGYSVCPAPTDAGCPPRVQRASGLVNTWRCWEGGMPREGMGAPRLTPRLILCISSIRLVPSCNLYNKPLTILKLSPKESGLQNQADPAPPATRLIQWRVSPLGYQGGNRGSYKSVFPDRTRVRHLVKLCFLAAWSRRAKEAQGVEPLLQGLQASSQGQQQLLKASLAETWQNPRRTDANSRLLGGGEDPSLGMVISGHMCLICLRSPSAGLGRGLKLNHRPQLFLFVSL
ncbi:uncharacterized protein [Equus przewalskii]|uniref:Uncharacterized protein isoform X1 n=1 Tax=Equus przewalskii TaxID=9798 RepID=A0ABM4L9V2_EQUPR